MAWGNGDDTVRMMRKPVDSLSLQGTCREGRVEGNIFKLVAALNWESIAGEFKN